MQIKTAPLLFAILLQHSMAFALTINVVNPEGQGVGNYRWLVEEDTSYAVQPGALVPDPLSVQFHASYSSVVAKGTSANAQVTLPQGRFHVSVLPDAGYSMGGASVTSDQASVTITVNRLPAPTAQISVFVFHDNLPINNEPDLPQESGLAGFDVAVFDAAGRYGQAGGQVSQDAFGNPLGTTYDANGDVVTLGNGVIKSGPDGVVLIKNLPPGKYGVQAIPPAGQDWHQTSTIEGTRTSDAWVKAGEPPYFTEFGPPGHHVFIGFVHTSQDDQALNGANAIRGRIVNLHNSRPPDFKFWAGNPLSNCWIGLNDLSVGGGRGIYSKPCNDDSTFSIEKVPPGNYQLVIWDGNLDIIFGMLGVTVEAGQDLDLGDVPVFNWFARLESTVFMDRNQNGFRDCVTEECEDPAQDDVGIPEQLVNLRFRDGTIYQSFPTDTTGFVPFDEVFPFFNWLVAEVDYTRLKPTGATIIVDNGGEILPDQGWAFPSRGKLSPQPQFDENGVALVNPNTGNNLSTTRTGAVLTQAFQAFLGQTSIIEWGKAPYAPGENGGISGVIQYATTRAENDPRYAVAEEWEPGIPRVQVNLYRDSDANGVIDDLNGDGNATLADVDNHPFATPARPFPQSEDRDRNGNGSFDAGDALQTTHSDSWDDHPPTGCQGEPFFAHGKATDCYDGLRNFNQVRDGVFDGGYIFEGIPAGTYIVEAVSPPGYEHVKEENKNVDFGDEFKPTPQALPVACVGDPHVVPPFLTLFPGQQVEAPFAGKSRPLCDRKQVLLTDGHNAPANFFLFTEVPKAARVVGFILDDLSNEFDANSPQFGEKYAPPFLPISFRDHTGQEFGRTYSDEWGRYNALLPSTYSANLPMPSGMSPSMLTACVNSPGPIRNPSFVPGGNEAELITDPFFNRSYSQFCYTFQYMPGTTTYLDTPVIPVGAFAGADQFPVDCEQGDHYPKIYSASGPQGGPYVSAAGQILTIVSEGNVEVPNPAFNADAGTSKTVLRDYGFGNTRGTVAINGRTLNILSWDANTITARIRPGTNSGDLIVTRGDNARQTRTAVTVTIGSATVRHVQPSAAPGATPIQDAIDLAQPNELILLAPGHYQELVVIWKPLRLQGWGAGSTVIDGSALPAERLQAWRSKVNALLDAGSFDLVPGQEQGTAGGPDNEADLFNAAEGAVVLVGGKNTGPGNGGFGTANRARVDGLTITGGHVGGGGVFVNGYARGLQISNNRIINNQGTFAGGIRIGHPNLIAESSTIPGSALYPETGNTAIQIRRNHVLGNGSLDGAGGGIGIGPNSHDYSVTSNNVCGNFSQGDGGGIGHIGLSRNGRIAGNTVVFNQSFNQSQGVSGGGLSISGAPPIGGQVLSPGAGSVRVLGNLFQGNLAGAGDGSGIRLQFINGLDVAGSPNNPNAWHHIELYNNIIANNVSGLAGAISLQDAARVSIIHNTIANNDSTGTAGLAFSSGPSVSDDQPAGVVSRGHTAQLASAFGNGNAVAPFAEHSNPALRFNIIWHNRSFHWDVSVNGGVGGLLPLPTAPLYADLGVLGSSSSAQLDPRSCLLTNAAGFHPSNISADPAFVREYANGARGRIIIPEPTSALQTAPAFDEGGNFLDVRFGPLSRWNPATGQLFGDYHLRAGSPAIGRAAIIYTSADLRRDWDAQIRPNGARGDLGADEHY